MSTGWLSRLQVAVPSVVVLRGVRMVVVLLSMSLYRATGLPLVFLALFL